MNERGRERDTEHNLLLGESGEMKGKEIEGVIREGREFGGKIYIIIMGNGEEGVGRSREQRDVKERRRK